MNIADVRQEYMRASLDDRDLAADPYLQFDRWFSDAVAARMPMLNAMTLATVAASGRPSARIVLLKGVDARGFVFYTNYRSRKGAELAGNSAAALLFYWTELEREVRIEGTVEKVSARESDEYFASRPLASRYAAIASPQSEVVEDRAALEARFIATERQPAPIRRGLRTGAAIGWFLMPSNSGRDALTACTTVCSTPAQRAGGRSRGSLHSRRFAFLRSCV